MTSSIVTVYKHSSNTWSMCTLNSNHTFMVDAVIHKERKTAEIAGQLFAYCQNLVYVTPGSTFITVYSSKDHYIVTEYLLNGVVKCRGVARSTFNEALKDAWKMGKDENKPVAPYFYLPEPEENCTAVAAA